jgi:hypothetical protein
MEEESYTNLKNMKSKRQRKFAMTLENAINLFFAETWVCPAMLLPISFSMLLHHPPSLPNQEMCGLTFAYQHFNELLFLPGDVDMKKWHPVLECEESNKEYHNNFSTNCETTIVEGIRWYLHGRPCRYSQSEEVVVEYHKFLIAQAQRR